MNKNPLKRMAPVIAALPTVAAESLPPRSHLKQVTRFLHPGLLLGKPVDAALFPNGFRASDLLPTWEIAYNHFHNRRGFAMPSTFATVHNSMVWESLTHAELDSKRKKIDE